MSAGDGGDARSLGRTAARPGPVVLLAGPGDSTDIVANHLRRRVPELVTVLERAPSRLGLARRRARRYGYVSAAGQSLFVVAALPLLRRRGRARRAEILDQFGLDDRPLRPDHRVDSVNSGRCVAVLEGLGPAVVVVNGTRIIGAPVLEALSALECPVVNMHAGLSPAYRGVHGGYWALAEGRPGEVGSTVHLVDAGIDTGTVLARAPFEPGRADSIATYPYLHLAAGLAPLAEHVQRLAAGHPPCPAPPAGTRSHLYTHPTLWGYLVARVRRGVR